VPARHPGLEPVSQRFNNKVPFSFYLI